MAKLIASTYADALFDLAIEKNKTEDWLTEIETIKTILGENPQFGQLMVHPSVSKEERLKLATEAFEGKVDAEIVGLIRIIIEKDRYPEIEAIFDDFIGKIKAHNGIGVAYVSTAKELTDKQKQAVEAKLLETTDYKTMEMHYTIEDDIIGGIVIRIGDKVVDSSIRTKLDGLKKQLLQVQI